MARDYAYVNGKVWSCGLVCALERRRLFWKEHAECVLGYNRDGRYVALQAGTNGTVIEHRNDPSLTLASEATAFFSRQGLTIDDVKNADRARIGFSAKDEAGRFDDTLHDFFIKHFRNVTSTHYRAPSEIPLQFLEGKIFAKQEELRAVQPHHSLLNIVQFSGTRLPARIAGYEYEQDDFWDTYEMYLKNLEDAIRQESQRREYQQGRETQAEFE